MIKIFNEFKRRNVFRVAGMYAIVAWLLMQLSAHLEAALNLPEWFDTVITVVVLLGFPVALLLAWAFEMTPQGVKRTTATAVEGETTSKTSPKSIIAVIGGVAILLAIVVGGVWLWGGAQQKVEQSATVSGDVIAEVRDTLSIAVLPFEDFSQAKDQEYFANGISEELLNVLARIEGLRVASRTSAFSFQGSNADTGTISEALGVGHILEGSIRKSGNTLRITAQLIDAANDKHMWSDTYDRPLTAENLFEIQDEIALAIVSELKGQLSIDTPDVAQRTGSLEAYKLYLRARENMAKRLPATLNAAVAGFEQVIELDANFAPAYAGLADTYILMPGYANVDEVEAIGQARKYIERALELAPNSAEALTAAALLANQDRKFHDSVRLATQAIMANPNYVPAYHRRGSAYEGLGQHVKALAEFEMAAKLDPLSAVILTNLGGVQAMLGDSAAARATHEKNIRFNPSSEFGYSGLATMKLAEGDYAGGHSLIKDSQALNPESEAAASVLHGIYTSVGLFDKALSLKVRPNDKAMTLLASGQVEAARQSAVEIPNTLNLIHFFLGDTAKAYPALRQWVTINDAVSQSLASNTNTVMLLLMCATVFQQESDPDAQILMDKLTAYYKGKSPADFQSSAELEAAGFLHFLKNEPQKAYPWFERVLDLGYARAGSSNLAFPGMEELRALPQWLAIEKRYEENARKHRVSIQTQLDNPKPNWLKNE